MRDRFALVTSILLTLFMSLSATRSARAIDQVIRKSSTTPTRGKITAISKTGLTVKPQVGDDVVLVVGDDSLTFLDEYARYWEKAEEAQRER